MAGKNTVEIIRISSRQNDLVKFALKLSNPKYRKKEKLALIEGKKSIDAVVESNMNFKYLFIKEDNPLKNLKNIENLVFVNDEILKKISTTKTPTDAVGIIEEVAYNRDVFLKLDKIALIDSIKDAGNLGTIIRSAVAFGVDGIVLFGDCVDLYNPKVIRASAQNMFKIPFIVEKDINFIKKLKKEKTLVSMVVDSKNNFLNYKFPKSFIIAFGCEANGLSEEIVSLSDEKLTILTENNVESLNLAISASIAFALIKINSSSF